MKNLTKTLLSIYVAIMMVAVACKKDDPTPTPPVTTPTTTPPVVTKSTAKDITKFSFAALSPVVDATIDASTKAITATVPAGTDVTKLVPTITISDKSTISPASGVAQDFSKEVSYTVTAEDGGTVVYKVNVTKELPPVQNDMVFYGGDDKKVYALDAETGTKKWEFLATGRIESAPAYVNGVLYVGTSTNQVGTLDGGKLYALDAKTGIKKWEFQTDGFSLSIRTSPMVLDGVIYFGTVNYQSKGDNYLYAVDATTGKSIWKFLLSDKTKETSIYSSPTVVDGLVYFTSYNKFIYAIDAKTGTKKWEYETLINTYFPCSPVVLDGTVYVGNYTFLALDAKTGSKKWEYKGIYGNGTSIVDFFSVDPTISKGLVFTANSTAGGSNQYQGKLLALNTSDGTKKWENDIVNAIPSKISADNENLYFVSFASSKPDQLNALDLLTGAKKWEFTGFGESITTPTPANGVLFVTTRDKKVYAFDTKTGAKKWEYTSSATILESCVVVDKNGKGFHSSKSGMVQ
jgi:eukaryotic-like serine/threonine-protein kinase